MLKEETESKIEATNIQKLDFANKPADFYYPEGYQEKKVKDADLPKDLVVFNNIIGQDASRRYNYHFLNDKEIITAIANTYQIINIETKQRKVFHGTEAAGIGSITVHPQKKYFAIAECGEWPNIYIYEYDLKEMLTESQTSVKLYRILRKGTEKSYSALSFNLVGDRLASVGGDPDYNMVIWNWMNESIILKAKAFSQEIFNVQFSSNFEGKLITSGIGHIKFWEMARTFTGLKLQGELGKFGQIDLSDISAYLEFPDGKVLSGTEYGTFLLWEGIFIKAHIMINEEVKCHSGLIEYMNWGEGSNEHIITGGHDGYIKWWSFNEIENLAIDDNSLAFTKPTREVLLNNPISNMPVKIINLVKQSDFCLVQDGNGYLLKITNLSNDTPKIESICEFHAGPILKLSQLDSSPYILAQGSDSATSLLNLVQIKNNFNQKVILERNGDLTTTACDIAVRESEDDSLVFAIGYSIGLFRIYQFDANKMQLELVNQLRAHEGAVRRILFSPDKSYLLTATDKEIFIFFMVELDRILPHCCIKKGEHEMIVDIDWHLDSGRILVALNTGRVEEIEIPKTFDSTKSYVMKEYTHRVYTVKFADGQLDREDEKKKRRKKEHIVIDEPGPSPIFSCKYANLYHEGDFLLTASKPYNDSLYLCDFEQTQSNPQLRPLNFWKLPVTSIKEYYVKYISKNFILLSTNKGVLQIRHKNMIDKYVEIYPNLYSSYIQDITVSKDERTLTISYRDGTLLVYNINIEGINDHLKAVTVSEDDPAKEDLLKSINAKEIILPKYNETGSFLKEIKKNTYMIESHKLKKKREELETLNPLEKEKKDDQEREKLKLAEEKKNKLRGKIQRLRDEYEKVVTSNTALYEEIRLSSDEIVVDDQYLEIVRKEKDANLADIKNKYDWLKANVNFTIDRITTFFLNSVETPKIYVMSLRSQEYVTTLRCPSLPEYFSIKVDEISAQIEDFEKKIDFKSLEEKYEQYLMTNDANKDKEDDYIYSMIERIRMRLETYFQAEQENQFSGKRSDSNKTAIKDELLLTNEDLEEFKKIFENKKNVRDRLRDYLENREKKRKGKSFKHSITSMVEQKKCPDSYSLKINYDSFYTEQTMKTTLLHKMKMFEFLKLLYSDREDFNHSVLELRKEKEELISNLQEKKNQLLEINDQLKMDPDSEKLEWLDFQMNEKYEYPEKDLLIKEDELDRYVTEKVSEDKELTAIFAFPSMNKSGSNPGMIDILHHKEPENSMMNVNIRERKRQVHESNVESELRSIYQIKFEYKKKKLIEECNSLIDEFDKKVNDLKKKKTIMSFKQKLGELELLIKHEEFSILRAFESDDNVLIRKLEDLYNDYQDNLKNLHACHDEIEQKEEELKRYKEDREVKEREFEILIANEKDAKEQLKKVFYQKKRLDLGNNLQDDKIENEEDLDLPRNISNQLKTEILNFRDARIAIDDSIDKLKVTINAKNKDKDHLVNAKGNLDRRRAEIREKINTNERKKARYLNLIDMAVPLKLDQFCKLEVGVAENSMNLDIHRLPIDISKAILISRTKLVNLQNTYKLIKSENENLEAENVKFDYVYDEMERNKKELEKTLKDLDTNFQNEQILKFGLVIDFDFLLKASENTAVDKLENEYKILKREADRQIDDFKNKIDNMKLELKQQLNENTDLLHAIKLLLEKNKKFDIKLEEKNNEINKKNNKKFTMYNIKEKKEKLKEILKLLQQQMEALKKEIEIFRKKGGHIYSTIASNLN